MIIYITFYYDEIVTYDVHQVVNNATHVIIIDIDGVIHKYNRNEIKEFLITKTYESSIISTDQE